jgi:hypothetical protein
MKKTFLYAFSWANITSQKLCQENQVHPGLSVLLRQMKFTD